MIKKDISYFINKLSVTNPEKKYTILGEGHEGGIITDGVQTYKIFNNSLKYDYYLLFEQLCGRFKDSKRFINIEEVFKIDNCTIISYKFKSSKPYHSNSEEEIKEFLIECWKYKIVCWDIKPSNFRIFNDGLKLVDYGKDIKPFNWKDFLFMVQRAYLMMKQGDSIDFRKKARIALKKWELDNLKEFIHFFNNLHKKILEKQKLEKKENQQLQITTFSRKKLFKKAIELLILLGLSNSDIIIYSKDNSLKDLRLKNITSLDKGNSKEKHKGLILDLINIHFSDFYENLLNAKKNLLENSYLITLIKNPFFYEHSIKSSLKFIKQTYLNSGYKIDKLIDSDWEVDTEGYYFSEYLIIQSSIHENFGHDVSLVIKTCYQDAHMIDRLVRHIVNQCEDPDLFLEKIVVLDSKQTNFLRQFSEPDTELMNKTLENLVRENVIDKYLISPKDKRLIEECYERWFNVCCSETHTVSNVPVFAQLFGFEQAKGEYILQVDSDAIIARRDRNHSYLKDMKLALQENKNALSISFNIAHDTHSSIKDYSSPKNGMFVPEVRFCLFNKERFFSKCPYPNEVKEGKLLLSWYRSVEQAQIERNLVSLRGGDPRTFYIHPPNYRKSNLEEWLYILDRAEKSFVPEIQEENIDLTGDIIDWKGPKRNESIIFIMCGRNIPLRKFLRCWQSVVNQDLRNWGAILIDDNSENNLSELMQFLTQEFKDRITLVSNHKRQGVLYNIYSAIIEYCENPYSVIIILDADDILLSNHITYNLRKFYAQGVDMTVGTFLRSDKGIIPYVPEFSAPRNKRGGDVWMHLRSFRKYLFENVKIQDMKIRSEWIDKFTELTYMVPISEMSVNPKHIKWPIYLYEPTQKRDNEHYRKNKDTINYVLSREKYHKIKLPDFPIKPPGELFKDFKCNEINITFIRHSEKVPSEKDPPLTEDGIELCHIFGSNIPTKIDLIITSETKRTIETGEHIRNTNQSEACKMVLLKEYSFSYMISREEREFYKKKFGWLTYLERWIKGDFKETNLAQADDVIRTLLQEVQSEIQKYDAKQILVVVHDNTIALLANFIYNKIITKIDYMNGLVLSKSELDKLLIKKQKSLLVKNKNQINIFNKDIKEADESNGRKI